MGGIIFAAALAAIAGYCVARQFAPERPRPIPPSYDLTPWGEVIEFPTEARWTAARKGQAGGGSASELSGQPSVTHKVIAHDRERF